MWKLKTKLRSTVLGFFLLVGLFGCGLKGSLDFPPVEQRKENTKEQKQNLTILPFLTPFAVQIAAFKDDSRSRVAYAVKQTTFIVIQSIFLPTDARLCIY